MQCRLTPAVPGLHGWTVRNSAYALPDGLPVGHPVRVVKNDGLFVRVADDAGREWTIFHFLVGRWQYRIGERWRDESDAVTLTHLAAELARYTAQRWPSPLQNERSEVLGSLRQILERHGAASR